MLIRWFDEGALDGQVLKVALLADINTNDKCEATFDFIFKQPDRPSSVSIITILCDSTLPPVAPVRQ